MLNEQLICDSMPPIDMEKLDGEEDEDIQRRYEQYEKYGIMVVSDEPLTEDEIKKFQNPLKTLRENPNSIFDYYGETPLEEYLEGTEKR